MAGSESVAWQRSTLGLLDPRSSRADGEEGQTWARRLITHGSSFSSGGTRAPSRVATTRRQPDFAQSWTGC